MLVLKDQPKGCKNEESVKKPVNTTKSTGTENFYASLISDGQNTSRIQNKNKIKRL